MFLELYIIESSFTIGKYDFKLYEGDGDLKVSSVGRKKLELSFVTSKEEIVYFSDSINFKPTE
ncbi:TPA: Csa1 family protein [Staphylococcus aureus]|nr:Csa1 family protein [Staphylococcus aureus]HEB2292710.1 Csa1 family protein [Staphylococcus aureus]